jgi:hypothetical protein
VPALETVRLSDLLMPSLIAGTANEVPFQTLSFEPEPVFLINCMSLAADATTIAAIAAPRFRPLVR